MSDLALSAESPSRSPLATEVARRRTFAIISHPDAGKTTLTEKFLLYGGAVTLFIATFLGVPVSTTHTITGAIVGVGAARRVSAVRWNVASSIVYAWVITIPASAIVAALAYWAVLLVR